MNEKQLQKAVEDVRKKGYLDITVRIDAKKFLEKPNFTAYSALCWEEGQSLFTNAFKILEAYKKKYGNN